MIYESVIFYESMNLAARFMQVWIYEPCKIYACVLLYAGTGIPAGTKSPPGIGDGEGRLPVVVRGDGDGGLFPDGEFPVAIFSSYSVPATTNEAKEGSRNLTTLE